MKKFILFITLMLLPIKVFASGYISPSTGSLTIEQGSTKTFTITAYNAIGDVSISSNNSSVASVNTSFWETGIVGENETRTGTITVSGVSVGSTTLTLTIDGATFDEDPQSLAGVRTITINVIPKATTTTTKATTTTKKVENTTTKATTTTTKKQTEKTTTKKQTTTKKVEKTTTKSIEENKLSKNNNLKEIIIDNYEVEKKDNNLYVLNVNNSVTEITINASSEDDKATIEGNGKKTLVVGENKFEIIIKSESGEDNIITLIVNRKDGNYIEDLNDILNNKNIKNADIYIKNDTIITKDYLKLIKENKKNISFNYYDEETNNLIYSWSLSGKDIKDINSFKTKIDISLDANKKILELSNYAEGIYVDFDHNGNLPEGTKVKLYVGNKYKDGEYVNVYHHDKEEDKLIHIESKIKVNNGYIEFDIEHCSEYFVTMSEIQTNTFNIFIIISIIQLFIIAVLIYLLLSKKLVIQS